MEEIVESTLSLLSVKHDQSHLVSQKILDPIYFLALVDTKAVWFKKWMVRKNWFFSLILVTSRLYVPDVCWILIDLLHMLILLPVTDGVVVRATALFGGVRYKAWGRYFAQNVLFSESQDGIFMDWSIWVYSRWMIYQGS